MEGLVIRRAAESDAQRIAELIGGDPGSEALGLVGDRERARRLGMGSILLPNSAQGWQHSVVAESGGDVVGVIQAGGNLPEFAITLDVVRLAFRSLGVFGTLRLLPRLRARNRVQTVRPEGTYYIGELDVDPAMRNRGIGGAMLDWAEADARTRGFKQMSLGTTTANPARRLYERHGFRVVETKTDPDYERYTGIAGRVLMLKDLE